MKIERQGQLIRLSGDLRHSDAAPLAALLAEGLAEGDLRVSGGGVSDACFGIVQVLVSATATARELARNLHIDLPETSALRTAARQAGIAL